MAPSSAPMTLPRPPDRLTPPENHCRHRGRRHGRALRRISRRDEGGVADGPQADEDSGDDVRADTDQIDAYAAREGSPFVIAHCPQMLVERRQGEQQPAGGRQDEDEQDR